MSDFSITERIIGWSWAINDGIDSSSDLRAELRRGTGVDTEIANEIV